MDKEQIPYFVLFAIVIVFATYLFYSPLPEIKFAQLEVVNASYNLNSSKFEVTIVNNGTVTAYDMTLDIRLMGTGEIPDLRPKETRVITWKRDLLPGEEFPFEESLIFTYKYDGHKKEVVSVGPFQLFFRIEEAS